MADKPKRAATLTILLSEAPASALHDESVKRETNAATVVQQAVAKEIETLK
ncbi:MAG TPA: hypothetical protein VKA80_03075 [Beijerinckiaceae bacterium]|nr:hypothetical protein [Beijerinckiaceae bacterium]